MVVCLISLLAVKLLLVLVDVYIYAFAFNYAVVTLETNHLYKYMYMSMIRNHLPISVYIYALTHWPASPIFGLLMHAYVLRLPYD